MQNNPFLVIHISSDILYTEQERIEVILLTLIENIKGNKNDRIEERALIDNKHGNVNCVVDDDDDGNKLISNVSLNRD